MSFTLCLNVSTIKTTPLLDKIRLVSEAGFDGVELWLNDVYEHIGRGGEVSDVEKALADYGLIVPCTIAMRAWGEASDLEYPLMLDDCKRRMDLAARLGSPTIVATPPRDGRDLGVITERYADLLKLGRESGIKPIMEYISFFGSVTTLNDARKVVEDVNDPDATVIVDAFHTWNSGGSFDDLRDLPLEMIGHYHFDDGNAGIAQGAQTDPDRMMPGEGCIDLDQEVSILKEKGYQGTVSLELFNRDLWAKDPADVLKIGMEKMQHYFGD